MNKNQPKQKPRNRFRWLLLLASIFMTLAGQNAMAQNDLSETVVPEAVVRMGDNLSFTVDVASSAGLTNAQLEVAAPAGFEFVAGQPGLIAGSLSGDRRTARFTVNVPQGNKRPVAFQVKALCESVEKTKMTYTLYAADGTTVLVAAKSGNEIANFINPILLTTYPAPVDVTLGVAATRIITMEQTAALSHANNIQINAVCTDKTGIAVTKLEVSSTGTGGWIDITATGLDASKADRYVYTLTRANTFTPLSYAGSQLREGSKIYIRETLVLSKCTAGTINYAVAFGDGTTFCAPLPASAGNAVLNVADQAFNPVMSVAVTKNPTSPTDWGKHTYTVSNSSATATLNDIYTTWNTTARRIYEKAFFSDASGEPVLLAGDTVFVTTTAASNTGTTTFGTGTATDLTLRDYYRARGFIATAGDSVYNDLPAGKTIYITQLWNLNFSSLAANCPMQINGGFAHVFEFYYYNQCGTRLMRPNIYGSGSTNSYVDGYEGLTLSSLEVQPSMLNVGESAKVYFMTRLGHGFPAANVAAGTSSHFIKITLPAGLDFDPAAAFPVRILSASKGALTNGNVDMASGRIQVIDNQHIIVQNIANTNALNHCVEVAVKPNGTVSTVQPQIAVEQALDWGNTGTQYRFGCSTGNINFVVKTPCSEIEAIDFSIDRTSMGWTNISKTAHISKADGANTKVIYANDNVSITSKMKINYASPLTITAADKLMTVTSYTGTQYLIKNPDRVSAGTLIYYDVSAGNVHTIPVAATDITYRNSAGIQFMEMDMAPLLLNEGITALRGNDSIRLELFMRTQQNLPVLNREGLRDVQFEVYRESGADTYQCYSLLDQVTFVQSPMNSLRARNADSSYDWRENAVINQNNFWWGGSKNTNGGNLLTAGEYRPNLDSISRLYMEINSLVKINTISTTLSGRVMGNELNRTLTGVTLQLGKAPEDYSAQEIADETGLTQADFNKLGYHIWYKDGRTFLRVDSLKDAMLNSAERSWEDYNLTFNYQGVNMYSMINNATFSTNANEKNVTVSGLDYPTSAAPVRRSWTKQNIGFNINTPLFYSIGLNSPAPEQNPMTNIVEWSLTISNNSVWASTDGVLPNTWLAFECPTGIKPYKLIAPGGAAIADISTAGFLEYDQDGITYYWVKVGNVNASTPQTYRLQCTYTACAGQPGLTIKCGASKSDYPQDPYMSFAQQPYNSPQMPIRGVVSTAVKFNPPVIAFSGDLAYIPHNMPQGTINYCEAVDFVGNAYNGTAAEVYNVKYRIELPDGMNFNAAVTPKVTYNGVTTNASAAYQAGREVFIELGAGIKLNAYDGIDGGSDEARVTFSLKTSCGFSNRSIIYANVTGESGCGAVGENVLLSSQPVMIEGVADVPVYQITQLQVNQSAYSYSATNSRNLIVQGQYTLAAISGATASNMAMIDIPANMTLVNSTMTSSKGTTSSFTQNGTLLEAPFNNFIAAGDVNNGAFGDTYTYTIELRPDNPAQLSCDEIAVRAYSGVTTEVWCSATSSMCTLVNPADVDQTVSTTIDQLALEFANITATGSYGGSNTEHVVISGELHNTGTVDAGKMNIDVYYFDGVQYVPVADANLRNIQSNIILAGGTTSFTMEGNIVYPESVCQLKLVLSRDNAANASGNAYLCYDFEVEVPTPAYSVQNPLIENICPMSVNTPIGEGSLPRYTYEWSPSDYLNNAAIANPLFSYDYENNPKPNGDVLVYNLTVTRPGCTPVSNQVTVHVKGLPSVQVSDRVVCPNASVNIPLSDPTNTTPGTPTTYTWSVETDMGTGLPVGGTGNTIFAASVANNTTDTITTVYLVTPMKDGCTGVTQRFTVKIAPKPTLAVKALTPICLGASIDLATAITASPGLTVAYFDDNYNELPSSTVIPTATGTQTYYAQATATAAPSCTGDFYKIIVRVQAATTINVQPVGAAICLGSSYTLHVTAGGEGVLSYVWKRGATVVGGNTSSYTISSATAADFGDYTVEVTGACGTAVISSKATISQKAETAISTQPLGGAICAGNGLPMSVVATGELPLTYQWKKNGLNITGAMSASYTAFEAGTYSVDVTGTCGVALPSSNAVVTLKAATQISMQPQGGAICAGANLPLSVSATGEGTLTYEWLFNGIAAPGVNNLSTYSATAAGAYSVRVTGECGTPVLSDIAVVSLKATTQIIDQPVGGALCTGSNLRLSVEATGEGILSYQWKHDGNPITGASNANYNISNAQLADAGNYTVDVSDACGITVSSSVAVVTIKAATAISTQPVGGAICSGDGLPISVVATGEAPLTYQWKKNGLNITGAMSATYTAFEAGTYSVDVTGACGTAVPSDNAVVTLNAETKINTQPQGGAICAGDNLTLNVDAGGQGTLTYEWRLNGAAAPGVNNTASYTATAAGSYTVVVTGACGASVTSAPAVVTLKAATVINIQPVGGAICAGSGLPMSVVATGEGTLNYQWKLDGANVGGNSASYTALAAGSYTVEVTGVCGAAVPSNAAVVTLKAATAITTQPAASSSICLGEGAALSVVATGEAPLTYQWKKNGLNITGAMSATYTAFEAGTYSVDVTGACGTAVPSDNAVVTLKAETKISMQPQGGAICAGTNLPMSVSATGEGTLTYEWLFNGIAAPGINNLPTYTASVAGNYSVRVTGECGSPVLSETAVLTIKAATQIIEQPVGAALCPGSNLRLSVEATGEGILSYQWKHDGNPITGAANANYSINNAQFADAGNYTVDVSDACGTTVSSTVAAVTVDELELTLSTTRAAICLGGSYDLSSAVGSTTGGTRLSYIVNGVETNSPFVQPAEAGTYAYDVVLHSAHCASLPQTFTLIVEDLPSALLLGGDVCVGGNVQFNAHTTPANGSGAWYSTNSSVATVNIATGEVSGVSAGVFELVYRHTSDAGCMSETKSSTFNVYPLPTVSVKDMTVCSGSVVHMADLVSNIHNGDKYEIYDAAVGGNLLGASITVSTTTTYYVEGIMTGVNCFSAARVPVTVTVVDMPVFTLDASEVGVCNGTNAGHIDLASLITAGSVNISNYTVEVYGEDGKLVTGTVVTPSNNTEIYNIRIVSNDVSSCTSDFQSVRVNRGSVQYVSLNDSEGAYEFCAGEIVTLSPSITPVNSINVLWTSSNPAVASVDNTGKVTAISSGQAIISYSHTESEGCHSEGSRAIIVNSLPQLTNVSHFAACEGETVMFSELASSNAGNKLNFYLNGNATAETADRVVMGTSNLVYTIEAEDMHTGCVSAAHTVTVTANAKPTFTLPATASICKGENLDLASLATGVSAIDHNLIVEDVAGNTLQGSIVTPVVSTSYRVRAIDNTTGCISLQQLITVTVKEKPVLAVEDLTACAGTTVDLNTAVAAGASALKFYRDAQAMTLVSNPSAVVAVAGTTTYYVQGEENGCLSEIHPIAVLGEAMPVFEITEGKFTVCEGEQMVEYLAPANFSNYTWTVVGGTIANQTGNKVFVDWAAAGYGSIAVSYETASGCGVGLPPVSHAVLIQASPDASFAIHDNTGATVAAVCAGSELMLSPLTTGGTWTVTPSALASVSGNTLTALSTITSVQTIDVSYTLTNSNGCSSTLTQQLSINPLPVSALANLTTDVATVCPGGSVELTATYTGVAPWSIVYTDGTLTGTLTDALSSVTIPVNATSIYSVLSITDGNGCANTAISGANTQAMVTLEAPVVITEQPQSVAMCKQDDESVTLSVSAVNAVAYQWYNAEGKITGETAETLDLTPATANSAYYYVEVIGKCETLTSKRVSIQLQLPVIEQKRNHTLWVNNNPDNNGGYSFTHYTWLKDGVQLQQGSHDNNMGVHYIDGSDLVVDAMYQVMLTTTDGRKFMSCPYSYIPQNSGASLRAYPNPLVRSAAKQVSVDVEIDDTTVLNDATILIYSSDGKYIGKVRCEGRRITPVEMPSVSGVYILKFVSSEIEKEIKIIVE
ncbi:MAG: Ig-like domain-containing protein [Prevotellaceae bacterium]|jgi:hypothetical protein|nr:Ig-like domain-containing protein [Prevotellaceae bacterium]